MYRDKERFGLDPTVVIRSSDKVFYQALKWIGPKRIFTCSYSDFFIEEADAWRSDAWDVIRKTPQHSWQILTKRPERIQQCLPHDWGNGWDNVWIGVSVENIDTIGRITTLSQIPAKTRFISFEPLLEFVAVPLKTYEDKIHWFIIGGESGNETGKYLYRPCELGWIRQLVALGKSYNIKVFVKQLGTHLAKELKLWDRKGGNIEEFPEDLRVREFP